MKITLTLKSPDAIDQAVEDAVEGQMGYPDHDGEDAEDVCDLAQSLRTDIINKLGVWVKHGEYVTVVIDTDLGTAEVQKA